VEWLLRMKEAIDLMESTMEKRMDIEQIARAAHSSPFHFQRMFHMLTGMTVAEYTRKRKLTLAAQELAMTSAKVLDVALKYGYDSPESFSKAFRKIHGISPSEARLPGVSLKAFPRISFHLSLKGDKDMDYRIVEKESFTLVGKTMEVSCSDGGQSHGISEFWAKSAADGTIGRIVSLVNGDTLYGVCLDMKPGTGDLTYMIAGETDSADSEAGLSLKTIPAATWAVFPCVGPIPGSIQNVFQRIFQEWFPATGYEHAGLPEMEVYPSGNTEAEDYRCEVWIPVVKK